MTIKKLNASYINRKLKLYLPHYATAKIICPPTMISYKNYKCDKSNKHAMHIAFYANAFMTTIKS